MNGRNLKKNNVKKTCARRRQIAYGGLNESVFACKKGK